LSIAFVALTSPLLLAGAGSMPIPCCHRMPGAKCLILHHVAENSSPSIR
jgi:hypothetical protein